MGSRECTGVLTERADAMLAARHECDGGLSDGLPLYYHRILG
jgi:hypothetical protein